LRKVHEYISEKLSSGEKLHFTLVDPDKSSEPGRLERLAEEAKDSGTDAFLIGGSLGVTPEEADRTAQILKATGLPVIVFPGNLNCITRYADAIFFMVLMNSLSTYYLIEAQVAAAPIIMKYGLEVLPAGYLVVYGDTAVAHVGRVHALPRDKPEIVLAYAWAAEMIGMKYFYIEAGSGALSHIPAEYPKWVKEHTKLIVIVGGGIRSPDTAQRLVQNGADIIVTGTIVEKRPEALAEIVKAIKRNRTSS